VVAVTFNQKIRLAVAIWLPVFTFAYGFIWSSVTLG